MESKGREYLGIIADLYLAAVLTIIPLIMKEGYWQIGDVKYEVYRSISLVCLAISVPVMGLVGICTWWNARRTIPKVPIEGRSLSRLSLLDISMLAYAASNILSWLGSPYQNTAWNGFREWYMGLLTQLLLVWGYFLVSRCREGAVLPIRCGQAALLAVSLLGILNRLKIDPFGWFTGWDSLDWEYNHMISTAGNINWLCGYLCIGIPLAVIDYLQAKEKRDTIFLYMVSLCGILLLFIQGSDSGVAVLGVGCVVLVYFAVRSREHTGRVLLLLIGLLTAFLVMTAGIRIRQSHHTFPFEDKSRAIMSLWMVWLPAILLLIWIYRHRQHIPQKWLEKVVTVAVRYGTGLLVTASIAVMLLTFRVDYSWGSGRGGLWALALRSFGQGDWWQKLFGVGPDCYAEYVYTHFDTTQFIRQTGRWENAIFANAHNEWLNQLVNTGLVGLISYMGIFAAGFRDFGRRCKGDSFFYLPLMMLIMYLVNSLFSFQQVLNAPFLFLILGVCENRRRKGAF